MNADMTVHDLIGRKVSGICFVQDYVEIHFDGPIVRCLSNPIVRVKEVEWGFPESGSRDALCALIGQIAESMSLDDSVGLSVMFGTDTELRVPLDSPNRVGPEAMHFVPSIGGPIQVW